MEKNLNHIRSVEDPMEKFMALSALQDRNETIFFKLLIENMQELGAAQHCMQQRMPGGC